MGNFESRVSRLSIFNCLRLGYEQCRLATQSSYGLGLFVMLYLAFSRFGNIPLGKDDEKPEFSRFSWIAMMFGAGIGVGIFFFGPSEPLAYFLSPPPHTAEPATPEALHQALAQSHFHWGLAIWGLYALVGGALAYSTF